MRKLFEQAGWFFLRQTGSHMIMGHPSGRREPIPAHKELGKGLERKLLKILRDLK